MMVGGKHNYAISPEEYIFASLQVCSIYELSTNMYFSLYKLDLLL